MTTTLAQFRAAIASLLDNGWVRGCSVMTDSTGNGRYGIHFTRNGREFWLNKDTIDNLPR